MINYVVSINYYNMEATIQQANTAKTTHLLKKLLKQKFGIDFKVKSESYSGGSSLRIKYTLGPDVKLVTAICKELQYGYFDGMTDEYKGVKVDPIIVDGYQLQTYKFVFVDQLIYEDDYQASRGFKAMVAEVGREFMPTSRQGRNDDDSYWYDIQPRNFVTTDASQIVPKQFKSHNNDFALIYKLKGEDTLYSTADEYKIPTAVESKVKALTIENRIVGVQGSLSSSIQVVEYSDKSFALIGDGTKAIKDELSKYGKWNRFLKCGAGWIFANKHREVVNQLIGGGR